MKEIFTVGEFSNLFQVDVQTLRYYDSIGLLVPAYRDSNNGYRHYRFDQVYQLASIRYLRRLGYSLKQIRDYLDSRDLEHTMDYLRRQSHSLREKWEELNRIDSVIQRKLRFVEAEVASLDLPSITQKTFAERYYIYIGSEEALYGSDTFYFYPTVVFYKGKSKQFGAYLHDATSEEKTIRESFGASLSVIQAGSYLCGYHLGPYETMQDTFDRIRSSAGNLVLDDFQIDFNIVDQFVERDSANYITEVQIPILALSR
jgi:DNA-binding transcriptional MerR regulator/effector-binding domain-containing protein